MGGRRSNHGHSGHHGPPGQESKHIFKASKKKLEPLVFYGPRNSLEAKPNVLQAFCEHFVNMLELDAAVLTIFATLWTSNLSFSMVGFKLV